MKTCFAPCLAAVMVFGLVARAAPAQTTAISYQGRLTAGTNQPTGYFDFSFTLFGASSGGTSVAPSVTNYSVSVNNGLFTVALDFGAGAFSGADRWLEIAVRTNGLSAFSTLSPRQPLIPAPYALFSTLGAALANGSISNSQLAANSVGTANLQAGSVTAAKIAPNQVVNSVNGLKDDVVIAPGGNILLSTNGNSIQIAASGTLGWGLSGNSNTTAGPNFLGTMDNQALEFRVNNTRALRLEPNVNGPPNVIGGADANSIDAGVSGATISGGINNLIHNGSDHSVVAGGDVNVISADSTRATISGGEANQIRSSSHAASIAGGDDQVIFEDSLSSAIGGGSHNRVMANAWNATVAGGNSNYVYFPFGTIGGGSDNKVLSQYATVPGGRANTAAGWGSFAAGYRARANNDGSFVWGDSTEADFSSTSSNQFVIRATGGVGIGTNNPQSVLHVAGTLMATTFSGDATGLTRIPAGNLFGSIPPAALPTNMIHFDGTNTHYFNPAWYQFDPCLVQEPVVTWDRTGNCDLRVAFADHGVEKWDLVEDTGSDFHLRSSDGIERILLPQANADVLLSPGGDGNVGIGTSTPTAKFHVFGNSAPGPSIPANTTVLASGDDGFNNRFMSVSGNQAIYLSMFGGYGEVSTFDYGTGAPLPLKLNANGGTVSVPVLEITGGADLAEPFQLSDSDIPKGAVLVIDDKNPGKLKMSHKAYDTRVAGIVSGANGIKPGVSLHQGGAIEGGENVALSGRVYALADTSNGPINPGDLLTTSEIPGHCMKVTDHARAQGATIGKAMSSLTIGNGKVLVLVSLQ